MQEELKKKIINNQAFRKSLATKSFYWFFHIYFSKYIKAPTADFQREWCNLLEDWDIKFLEIIGFRGSAKTTYSVLAFPIWAMINGKSHYTLILGDTFNQIKDHIYNLKNELENNKLLIGDFGEFEGKELWTATDIVIPKYDAKITARSTGQKIRGIRYKQWRVQLISADDLENQESVRTKELRDKTFRWFVGDVIPAGQEDTKIVLIGNLLHRDCLMSRILEQIKNKSRDGIVMEYPIVKNNKILWNGKFQTMADIDKEERKVNDYRTWQREYLLKLIPDEGQIVKEDWICYYNEIPQTILSGTGVDLAISKKDTSDYTAMISGKLSNEPKIYILPNIVNERLSGFETTERARLISRELGNGTMTPFWVEDVGYQAMQIEAMQKVGLPAQGIKVSSDKRARLMTISTYIQNGMILFPRSGCEDLISQLVGFGIESHDDLVDAFVLLVQGLMSQYNQIAGHFTDDMTKSDKTILGNLLDKQF